MNKLLALTVCGLVAGPAAFAQTATTPSTPPATQATPAAEATSPATPPATTPADPATQAESTMPTTDPVAATSGPTEVEYVTAQPEGSVFSSDLVGYSVYGSGDEKIGDINDILIDGEGEVQAVVIGVGGFLGIGEKDVAVTLPSLTIEMVDDSMQISISATEETLNAAPEFNRADGTSSDRLGRFERVYDQARAEAAAAYDAASQRAGELYKEAGELTDKAGEKANELIDQGRAAINDMTKDSGTTEAPAVKN